MLNKYDFLNDFVYDERDSRIPHHVRIKFNRWQSDGELAVAVANHPSTGWCVLGWVDHIKGDHPYLLWSEVHS